MIVRVTESNGEPDAPRYHVRDDQAAIDALPEFHVGQIGGMQDEAVCAIGPFVGRLLLPAGAARITLDDHTWLHWQWDDERELLFMLDQSTELPRLVRLPEHPPGCERVMINGWAMSVAFGSGWFGYRAIINGYLDERAALQIQIKARDRVARDSLIGAAVSAEFQRQ